MPLRAPLNVDTVPFPSFRPPFHCALALRSIEPPVGRKSSGNVNVCLLRRISHEVSPLGPGPIVVPDLRVAEEVLRNEPRVRRLLADPSGFTDPARLHSIMSSLAAQSKHSDVVRRLFAADSQQRLKPSGKIPGATGVGSMFVALPGRPMPSVCEWRTTAAFMRSKSRQSFSPGSGTGRTSPDP